MTKEESSLKNERRKCYEAEKSCRAERKNFDGNCPTSWVNHFIRKYQFERYKKTLAEQGVNIADQNALSD
ncbi:hypothetical protein CAEBREN_20973 [Caenorhabditis brenneri]|uniref:Uncharacterized protein n=1 Tax=Caenorhabditis brenneri TaxID=135651 RepID=G0NXW3_CAEBE|nr:hypothetical protein CAEBREN_20973 [Caenorhabditis brenneri]